MSARSSAPTGTGSLGVGLRAWLGRRVRGTAHPALSLGGVLLALLALQIATGTLLLFHFVPDAGLAFESVRRIMRDVPYGWLVRLLHVHGANLMIIALIAHLLTVAVTGAYKPPRRVQWLAGCVLLVATLGAALTGYILPWSQLSYWATTVVTASIEYVPLLGEDLVAFVRGGERVGPPTFRRAFAAHVALIPLTLLAVASVHLALVARFGPAPPPARLGRGERAPESGTLAAEILRQLVVVAGFGLVLVALVVLVPNLFFPAESFLPADPFETPPDVKPEWYFLWQYALPHLLPQRLALLLQGFALTLLVLLPWLDRGPGRHPLDRPWIMLAIGLGTATWGGLTLYGALA